MAWVGSSSSYTNPPLLTLQLPSSLPPPSIYICVELSAIIACQSSLLASLNWARALHFNQSRLDSAFPFARSHSLDIYQLCKMCNNPVVLPESLNPIGSQHVAGSSNYSFSEYEREWIKGAFAVIDEDQDGTVSKEELGRFMEKLGLRLPKDTVASIWSSVSTGKEDNDYLDIDAFHLLYASTCKALKQDFPEMSQAGHHEEEEDEDLMEAFNVFDRDGDGFICPAELQRVLCNLGFAHPSQAIADCEEMISKVDQDGNGLIDFPEFKLMMASW
eukprot:c29356_g1_i1 orf=308-1129(-)